MNKEKISVVSIVVNVVLAFSKIIIGLISKSSAVFAQGLDSATDIVSSLLTFIGIHIAKKPADKKHPYGHHKFEVLSGLSVTIILFITGIWVIYEGYKSFLDPKLTEINYLALAIMLVCALVNEIMARAKIYYGKKEHSIALISDGMHSRVDVISSVAVFLGLLLTPFFKYTDPMLTIIIGLYILKQSISLGREALDSLLDVSAGEETESKIKEVLNNEKVNMLELKTQKKGSVVTANISISLPKTQTVEDASKLISKLQKKLSEKITNLEYVAIQVGTHEIEGDYYNTSGIIPRLFGRGEYGWQRRGRFKEELPQAKGSGPNGKCICPKCGHEIEHKRGIPCSRMKCPKCGSNMARE